MRNPKSGISGLQICFFMFAVLLVSVPLGRLLTGDAGATRESALLQRVVPFVIFGALLALVPSFRHQTRNLLAVPIPASKRGEVALACASIIGVAFATTGARALWVWNASGAAGLSTLQIDPGSYAHAVSATGLAQFLVIGVLVAPVLEELLCRGFIYRSFEQGWNWVVAMVLTSIVFGAYHSYFLNAFLLSIVLVCVYRRTGSLRAAICVHASSNLLVWYPALGQHLFPDPLREVGELSTWAVQLFALAAACIVLPAYVWISRDRAAAPTVLLHPHATLQK